MKKTLVIIWLWMVFFSICCLASAQTKEEAMGHAMALAAAMKKSGIDIGSEYQLIYRMLLPTEPKEKEGVQTIESYGRFMPSCDVEAMPGEVRVIEAFSEYNWQVKAFGKLPLKFSLENKYIGLKNTSPVTLPAHLTGLAAGIEVTLPFFTWEKAYMRIGVKPSFYTDDWSFETSAFRIPTYLYAIYLASDKWSFILGVAVSPDYENEVWPVIGFIYKPSDKLTFNIIPKRPNITYKLNERIGLFIEGGGTTDEFEVGRQEKENVVLLYKEKHAGFGLKYKFNEFFLGSFTMGRVFGRTLKYRDSEGKINVKSGLYTELRINIQF
ncbi:MAG: hypothetical protein NC936_03120 [Candidatus Omnitrophica bacterium]|nr:hypothetical protein [Candidatus Omnitrophota bacterium]MCM8770843.1 hypothetical protein [Candidatus Omnitrophota bacterium]